METFGLVWIGIGLSQSCSEQRKLPEDTKDTEDPTDSRCHLTLITQATLHESRPIWGSDMRKILYDWFKVRITKENGE